MSENYSNMSLDKLRREQAKIEKAIIAMEAKEKKAAMAKMVAIAKDSGIDLAELAESAKRPARKAVASAVAPVRKKKVAAKKRGKVPPKYRNPDDKNLTWTGRGKQPVWVREYLENGGNLDTITI